MHTPLDPRMWGYHTLANFWVHHNVSTSKGREPTRNQWNEKCWLEQKIGGKYFHHRNTNHHHLTKRELGWLGLELKHSHYIYRELGTNPYMIWNLGLAYWFQFILDNWKSGIKHLFETWNLASFSALSYADSLKIQ